MSALSSLTHLATRILTRYFRLVPMPPSFEQIAAAEPVPAIVTQSDSIVIEALLASIAERRALKLRKVGSDTRAASPDPHTLWWCSLHDERALETLLAPGTRRPISTLNLFHVRGPVRSNPTYRMSLVRLWRVFIGGRFLFIIFGEPIPTTPTHHRHLTPKRLRRLLKLDFYRNLKLIRGTPFQPLESQERAVLGGAEFDRELDIIAQRFFGGRQNGTRDASGFRRARAAARKEFYAVAAHPRRFMYGLAAPISKFILNRLFKSIATQGLEHVVRAVRRETVVLVPMHRSHLDYVLIGSLLYHSNINPALVAAGINLNFWPVGPVVRSLGAYFVRRESRHNRVHALVLRRYVKYLAKRGHLQEFFIEGGRSRTGRMRPPKVGLLSMLIDSWVSGDRRDILFVPVSITYENVVEEREFEEENTGGSKVKESFLALLRARRVFRRTYGDAILRFGEPISLRDFVAARERASTEREIRPLAQHLGSALATRIRDQSNPGFTALTYAALLMAPHYGMPRGELIETIRGLATLIEVMRTLNPELGPPTPTLQHFLDGRAFLLDDLVRSGVVHRGVVMDEEIFFIPGKRRFNADFYRNGLIHLFLSPALFAISELVDGSISDERIERLRTVLAYDFLLPERESFLGESEKLLGALVSRHLVEPSRRFTHRAPGIFIPEMILPTLEAYLWTVENLIRAKGTANEDNESGAPFPSFSYPRFLDHLQGTFKSGAYAGIVSRTEAAARHALISVLESLQARKLVQIQDQKGKRDRILVTAALDGELVTLRECVSAIRTWSLLTRSGASANKEKSRATP